MAKYNFYLNYSHRDQELAQSIFEALTVQGYTVFIDTDVAVGLSWADAIAEAIASSDCFIPVITDAFLSSQSANMELNYAVSLSQGRAQAIFPLYFSDQPLPPSLKLLLFAHKIRYVRQPEDLTAAIDSINRAVHYSAKLAMLYEKLTEYRNLKHAAKEAETACQLLQLICEQWENLSTTEKKRICPEICQLMEQLSSYPGQYGEEAKGIGRMILNAASGISALLCPDDQSLFFSAFAVRVKYWEWEMRTNGFDLIYSGDVFQGIIDPCPISRGIEQQKPYLEAFVGRYQQEQDNLGPGSYFLEEEIAFINKTFSFVLSKEDNGITPYRTYTASPPSATEEEGILLSIAKFMQEGNKLFDALQKRGVAGDFLKCLLTSYERLKNYCQIVGATEVAADCVDRIVEIRNLLSHEESGIFDNEKAENGIKSLLGFTLHNSGNYDVFISFKSEDSDLAEKLYQLCQRHMKVPFWSKRSLPELSESEYAKAIYQALDRSTHFAVVFSKLEHLEADWVSQEMCIFHREKSEGRKPSNSNFIFVATDDLYERIIRNNKLDIPIEYRGYQIIKMSEYQSTLLQYIN